MNEIRLTDGSLLEVKVNFLTVKLLVDLEIESLTKKYKKNQQNDKLKMEVASKMIYAIIRSSGKRVDMEDALILTPMDNEVIEKVIDEFNSKLEKFKKKQGNRIHQKMK